MKTSTPHPLLGYSHRPGGLLERVAHFDDESVTIIRDAITGRLVKTIVTPTRPSDMQTANLIIQYICNRYGVTPGDLEGPARPWHLVWPRWLAIGLIRLRTRFSLYQIGDLFNRDHVTILHAINGLEDVRKSDSKLAREMASVHAAAPKGTSQPPLAV